MGGNTWTSPECSWLTAPIVLDPQQRSRIDRSQLARDRIADSRIMNIDFYPRESHLVTFRDPWSFPVLFHPGCNHLVKKHLEKLAQKVTHLQMNISPADPHADKCRDCFSLRLSGRVSRDPVLSPAIPNTRSRRFVLPPCAIRPGRTGPIRAIPAQLPTSLKPAPWSASCG